MTERAGLTGGKKPAAHSPTNFRAGVDDVLARREVFDKWQAGYARMKFGGARSG